MYAFPVVAHAVAENFCKIALSQIDAILEELAGDHDVGTKVHEVRKRAKKLRGLLRLVRLAFPDFGAENAAIRDAAGTLAAIRDADAMEATVSALIERQVGDTAALARIRTRLQGAAAAVPEADAAEAVETFAREMHALRQRAEHWDLEKDGFAALAGGLKRSYKAAKVRMKFAKDRGLSVNFHDWRKASKAHGYHLQLLRKAAPDVVGAERELWDRLARDLGEHHDLNVLVETAKTEPDRFGPAEDISALDTAIAGRKAHLEADVLALGAQLLAERPGTMLRRFRDLFREGTRL